jgi:hypothetical protein
LPEKRRCSLQGFAVEDRNEIVWYAGGVALPQCPRPLVSGDSSAFLEIYKYRNAGMPIEGSELPAKTVDALVLLVRLEQEEAERLLKKQGQRENRRGPR